MYSGIETWPRQEEAVKAKIYDTGCANTVKLLRFRTGENFSRGVSLAPFSSLQSSKALSLLMYHSRQTLAEYCHPS